MCDVKPHHHFLRMTLVLMNTLLGDVFSLAMLNENMPNFFNWLDLRQYWDSANVRDRQRTSLLIRLGCDYIVGNWWLDWLLEFHRADTLFVMICAAQSVLIINNVVFDLFRGVHILSHLHRNASCGLKASREAVDATSCIKCHHFPLSLSMINLCKNNSMQYLWILCCLDCSWKCFF